MDWRYKFPILLVDDEVKAETAEGRALRAIIKELESRNISVIEALTYEDALQLLKSQAQIGTVLIDWDIHSRCPTTASSLIENIRKKNEKLPILLLTDHLTIEQTPSSILNAIEGYIWKIEDTPFFIAGRIEHLLNEYLNDLLPPFFKALWEYVENYNYSWHTPGHSGGIGFLKSPAGKLLFDFFGEKFLRADLSVSAPELGSLMNHSGVVGESEKKASVAFQSDHTYYVTNGTSSSNKIVFLSCVGPGDLVLVDRNCHKSIIHAITMCRAIPIYMIPSRNGYGIIGPIPSSEMTSESIHKKIKNSPFLRQKKAPSIRLAVLTNSTYDGLCYNTSLVEDSLQKVDNLLFDEAWYGYACFHPFYKNRFGMARHLKKSKSPTIFSTQSTHKLLFAFSQASMIHVKEGKKPFSHDRFNEAFMMHTSTSPQYGIIASLDISTRMMEKGKGELLLQDSLEEAITFRKKMAALFSERKKFAPAKEDQWWFEVWQPNIAKMKTKAIRDRDWRLSPNNSWHGFGRKQFGDIILDPLKVTVLTPGINKQGEILPFGIPATLVSVFLRNRGIVVEKTGVYSFLILFSMGITKGKSGTLLAELFECKRHYDKNTPLSEILPQICTAYPDQYNNLGFKDLAHQMHSFFKKHNITQLLRKTFASLPQQKMLPCEAFDALIKGEVELFPLDQLGGKISANCIEPYPPGIPLIMPGESFAPNSPIVDYLSTCEEFDNLFPGFETEVHGVEVKKTPSKGTHYKVFCISQTN